MKIFKSAWSILITSCRKKNLDYNCLKFVHKFSFIEPDQGNSTIWSKPGYSGRFKAYFASISLPLTFSLCGQPRRITHLDTNRPPRKCLPLYSLTPSFGAVRLIRTSGCNPTPSLLPDSTFQPGISQYIFLRIVNSAHLPDGTSTETIGSFEAAINWRAVSNGTLIGGWNENPKIASSITSHCSRLAFNSDSELMVEIAMFLHCVCSRFEII